MALTAKEADQRLRLGYADIAAAAREKAEIVAYQTFVDSDFCGSEVERLFYVAWLVRGVFEDISGSHFGGHGRRIVLDALGSEFPEPPKIIDPAGHFYEIAPQFCIGKYRADFAIRLTSKMAQGEQESSPIVVVEIDGHDFHDRTKEQASHDRRRDRVMQVDGFRVIRFTGSDVFRDPYACVVETEEFIESLD